ncbi:major capsid protein, partial [Endozoicomonas atrinae]
MDIFNDDAFSLTSLTATINEMEYKPGRLGELGLFRESGINTTTAVVESVNGV